MSKRRTIEIDRSGKEIRIRNNEQLYRFIDSGAAAILLPIWDTLSECAETVDPAMTVLGRVVEAAFAYFAFGYELIHEHVLYAPTQTITVSAESPQITRGG